MGHTLDKVIADLPQDERDRIEARTAELINVEMLQQAAAAQAEELLGRPVPMMGVGRPATALGSEPRETEAASVPPANPGEDDEGSCDASPSGDDAYEAEAVGGPEPAL